MEVMWVTKADSEAAAQLACVRLVALAQAASVHVATTLVVVVLSAMTGVEASSAILILVRMAVRIVRLGVTVALMAWAAATTVVALVVVLGVGAHHGSSQHSRIRPQHSQHR